jgi:hypothetical protein
MADTTDLSIQAEILAELWMDYRDDEGFTDFIEYNDLGLPLAYAVANGIVEMNQLVERYIEETFTVLLSVLNVKDTGFESLNNLFDVAEETNKK